jgi:hypothetical protein
MNWLTVLSHLYVLGFGFLFGAYLMDILSHAQGEAKDLLKVFVVCLFWPIILPGWIFLALLMG